MIPSGISSLKTSVRGNSTTAGDEVTESDSEKALDVIETQDPIKAGHRCRSIWVTFGFTPVGILTCRSRLSVATGP